MPAVLKFVGLRQSKFLADQTVPIVVLRVARQIVVLLLVEDLLKRSVQLRCHNCLLRGCCTKKLPSSLVVVKLTLDLGQLEVIFALIFLKLHDVAVYLLNVVLEPGQGRWWSLAYNKQTQLQRFYIFKLTLGKGW